MFDAVEHSRFDMYFKYILAMAPEETQSLLVR